MKPKRSYRPPALSEYGPLARLTHGVTGASGDGASGKVGGKSKGKPKPKPPKPRFF